VLRGERCLGNPQCTLHQHLGVRVAALVLEDLGKAVEAQDGQDLPGHERRLSDRKRALQERIGIGVAALATVDIRQGMKAQCG
jgi:hypothetical protein